MHGAAANPSRPAAGLLFSDLDGTMLDHHSYRPSAAVRRALAWLSRVAVTVVPVTSKTAAEVLPLMRDLGLDGPAVVEGGAATLDGGGRLEVVGPSRAELLPVLSGLRAAGIPARGFSDMTVAEVMERTGLAREDAAMAMERSASEPFVIDGEVDRALQARLRDIAAAGRASLSRGGRFWHLAGAGIDKASGVRAVLGRWPGRRPATAAVGDAWNDLPMLAVVDRGFLLGGAVAVEETPPGVVRVAAAGPRGFVEAVGQLGELWALPGAGMDGSPPWLSSASEMDDD